MTARAEQETTMSIDFTELGRQAYRAGLSASIGDNPAAAEIYVELPQHHAQRNQAHKDYSTGYNAERRALDPVAALTDDVRYAEQNVADLAADLAETGHSRRQASLKRCLAEAEKNLSRLVTDLGAAVQEQQNR